MVKRIPLYPRIAYARKLAKELIIKLKINSLPVDPFDICQKLGIVVKSVTEAEAAVHKIDPFEVRENPQCDAKTYLTAEGRCLIVYDDWVISQGRINWTIAHEIAHVVLGHLADFEQTEIYMGLTDKENEVLEKEANAFAAELLAPAEVLINCQPVKINLVRKLCGLSEAAAAYRVKYLKNYRPDRKFPHLDQEIHKQFYNFTLSKNGITPEQSFVKQALEQDQETGRILEEWPYLLHLIKQDGEFALYGALKKSIAKIDYDTLFIYSQSEDLKDWLKAKPFAAYIINLIEEKLGIEVMEVLRLEVGPEGKISF